MRKLFWGLIIIIGIVVMGIGVYLQLSFREEEIVVASVNDDTFERINAFNTSEVCTTYDIINTYMNTSEYTKISFNYPDCVHEYKLSFWYKALNDEENNIKINISTSKDTLNNYMNTKKTKLISMKNDDSFYENVIYTDVEEITTKDDIVVNFIEANYDYTLVTTQTTYDIWYIAAQIDDEYLLTYELTIKNGVISYSAIKELFNNIKVEEDAATFKNSREEGDYQVGSIKQNISGSYEHGYILTYKVSNKYPEVDSYGSNYDESTFGFEDLSENFYANMKINVDSSYNSLEEKIDDYKKIVLTSYEENTDTYRNTSDTGVLKKNIDDKEVYYYIYTYDYYLKNEKISVGYISYIYYEIAEHFYLEIELSTKDIEINEALISEFLNFTVEEY